MAYAHPLAKSLPGSVYALEQAEGLPSVVGVGHGHFLGHKGKAALAHDAFVVVKHITDG